MVKIVGDPISNTVPTVEEGSLREELEFIRAHPDMSGSEIAEELGLSLSGVSRRRAKLRNSAMPVQAGKEELLEQLTDALNERTEALTTVKETTETVDTLVQKLYEYNNASN